MTSGRGLVIVTGLAVVFGGLVATLALVPVGDRTQLVMVGYPTVTALLAGVVNYVKVHATQSALTALNDSVTNGELDGRVQRAARAAIHDVLDEREHGA